MKKDCFIKKCRVCNTAFSSMPLIAYNNMPIGAQKFLKKEDLKQEQGIDLIIYQCSGCGLIQLSNQPVPYYKDVIRSSSLSEEMRNFRLIQFKKFIDHYKLSHKKILEVGCGRGEYLKLMQQFNIDAYGIEHNSTAVNICQETNLKVSCEYLDKEEQQLGDGPFDAFMILNFLEHIPDPNLTLRAICNNLKADAVGLIEVPNFDQTLKQKLFFDFIADHLFYFTEETLRFVLQLNGFEVLEINTVWHNDLLSATVKKRSLVDVDAFQKTFETFRHEILSFLEKYRNQRIAVWGASHHALTILSMLEMQNYITYVVDSAPFKQNKYTPATHIPIVSPETLKLQPVDVVIVMAAGYSDEVASILKKNYDQNITIAILRDTELELL